MKAKCIAFGLAAGILGLAHAAVTPDEAKELGTTLTPWGAIKAGNRDGSIPAWDGGLPVTTAPAGFKPDSGRWADPFANEKPLYSISAKNLAEYADKVPEVAKELMRRYPTFRMDVYPTHRVVNYPKFIIDETLKNATRCKTIENGVALSGCFGGLPFPIPKTGNEAMWNIQTAFKPNYDVEMEQVYVDADGTPVTSAKQRIIFELPYNDPKETLESFEQKGGQYFKVSGTQLYPPRIAGDGTMVIYFTNPVERPNKGWNYQQGNRRVRSLPDAQYDYPLLPSGGAQFFDETGLFAGKQDRFDFKLQPGTKEMLIPYNAYRMVYSTKEQATAVGGGKHPNPDLLRWELHRVRIVDATLKPGMRHAFAKRRFYIDEDFPGTGVAEAWDHAGKLYKGTWMLPFWMYDKQVPWAYSNIEIDLATGIQYYLALLGDTRGISIAKDLPSNFFTPEGLSRRSTR